MMGFVDDFDVARFHTRTQYQAKERTWMKAWEHDSFQVSSGKSNGEMRLPNKRNLALQNRNNFFMFDYIILL